jgi:hypothetical protein
MGARITATPEALEALDGVRFPTVQRMAVR